MTTSEAKELNLDGLKGACDEAGKRAQAILNTQCLATGIKAQQFENCSEEWMIPKGYLLPIKTASVRLVGICN